jgi:hypothetical protein
VGPLSILKIRGTNPLIVVDGGRDLKRKAEDLDELIGKQVHAVQELEQGWKGKAANAARGQAYRNIEHQHRFHEITDAMAMAMIAGGQNLATLRDVLLNWVSTVSQMFNVADDGVVTTRAPSQDGKYVYMYGTQDGRTNDGLHVARVPANLVGQPKEYEYWNGTAFSGNDSNASPPSDTKNLGDY